MYVCMYMYICMYTKVRIDNLSINNVNLQIKIAILIIYITCNL